MIRKITEHEALILDFQLARCVSPVLDLSTTFYSCTDKALWDEKFDVLLQFYYNELFNTITLLGSNPRNIYSWDMFMNEVNCVHISQ